MVNQNDLQHLETELNSNGNVSIQSGGDTTLNGGQIFGDKITGSIGGDLNIISQQDEEHYYSEQESAGFRLGIGLYGSPSSFSMNYSKMEADSDYVAVQEQSGIFAGDGGFNLTVGGATNLQGGGIVGSNPDNNVLNTGSLNWDQLENHAEYDIESMSIGVSLSTGGSGGGGGSMGAMGSYTSDDGNTSSTTYSVISDGNIEVRSNPGQSLDDLKRDEEEAHPGLERIFGTDQIQDVEDEAELQQLLSQMVPEAIGNYAKSQTDHADNLLNQAASESDPDKAQALRDEATEIKGKWDEQGSHRLTLHTLTGVLSGDVMGGVGSLAVAVSTPALAVAVSTPALAVAVSTPALANALDDMGIKGPLRDSILLATSAAVGGAANGTTGAMNTTGQTVNNFLNHEKGEIEALVDELLECQTEECQKDVAERYQELSDQNLQGLIVACGQESTDCANDTRLQGEAIPIYQQYIKDLSNNGKDDGIAVNVLISLGLEYGDEMTAGQEAHLETLTKEVFPDATPEQIATVVAMIGGVGKRGGGTKGNGSPSVAVADKQGLGSSGGNGQSGNSTNSGSGNDSVADVGTTTNQGASGDGADGSPSTSNTNSTAGNTPNTETYFRVEGGGSGSKTSQNRITANSDGSININPGCSGQLCVSVGNADHANYYLTNKRSDGTVVVFEVDAKLHKEIMDSAIPQRPIPGISRDPNAPKVVDPNQPETALELPKVWESLLEKNSSNARVLSQDEFFKEFGK